MARVKGIEGVSGQELSLYIQQGAKFVVFQYCISVVIMTFKRGSDIYFVKPGENVLVKGLPFTLLSLLLGWWGIPWGPIFTIQALATNLKGGKDVTAEILTSLKQPPTQQPPTP